MRDNNMKVRLINNLDYTFFSFTQIRGDAKNEYTPQKKTTKSSTLYGLHDF